MKHADTEWKFSATRLDVVENALTALADAKIVTRGEKKISRVHDEYFDTKDWRIFRSGYSLRIRRIGRSREATLKALGGRDSTRIERRDITQRIASHTLDALFQTAGPVSERILRVCKRGHLFPLAEVQTVRRETPLQVDHAAGTLFLDRSVCSSGEGRAYLHRVELRLTDGQPEVFSSFVDRLKSECSLEPSSGSRYSWAISVAHKPPPQKVKRSPTVEPTSTIGRVGAALLEAQVSLLLWNEPGTRMGDDPKYVHDMRVAARRVRAALRLLREAGVPRDLLDELDENVSTLGSALGAVRDLDVRIEQTETLRPSLISVARNSLDPYLTFLKKEREPAREAMIRYLDSADYRSLLSSLKRDVMKRTTSNEKIAEGTTRGSQPNTASGEGVGAEGLPVPIVAPRLIRRARRKVVRLGDSLSPTSAASGFHHLRVLCKRLRYTLEFMEPVYGEPCRSMIEDVTKVQDLLGELQDSQVAIDSLRDLSHEAPASLPGATLQALGEVAQIYRHRQESILAEFPSFFRRLHGKKWKALKKEFGEKTRERDKPKEDGSEMLGSSPTVPRAIDPPSVTEKRRASDRKRPKSKKG